MQKNVISYSAPVKTTELLDPTQDTILTRVEYTWQYFVNPGVQNDTLCWCLYNILN